MADYYPLLSRAVAALPDSTPEARTAIYDRARNALLGQLQNIQPPLEQADIDREVQALDAAVARIEAEATGQPAPEPPPAPTPVEAPEPSEPATSPATAASSPPAEPAKPPEEPSEPSEPAAPAADSPDTLPGKPAEEPAAGETSTPASPVRPVLPPAPEPKRPSAPIAPPPAAPADAAGGAGTDTPPEAATAGAGMMAAGTAVTPPSPAAPARRVGEADHSPSPEVAAAPDDRSPPSARPRAPRPRKQGGSRIGYIVAALLFIAASGVAGFFAWSSRISPQEIQTTKIATPKPGATAPAAASDPGKIGERAAGGEEPSAGAPDAGSPSTPPSAPDSPASGSQGDTPSAGAPVAQASPDKPAGDAPANPSADPAANPSADTPSDKPADTPADQPADKPASGDAGTPPAGAAPAQTGQNGANANNAGVPVAQRAAILVQAPTKENAQAVKTLTGVVVWRQDNVHRGSDQPLSLAIRADVEIPEAKFRAIMTIEKNLDPTLPASHTITWRFQASGDGTVPGIDQIDAPQMRDLDRPQPSPLLGANAKITNSIFITALAASNQLRKTNLDNLKERGWIDLPLKLTNGRIAKLTLEKGNPGDKVFEEVMKKWSE